VPPCDFNNINNEWSNSNSHNVGSRGVLHVLEGATVRAVHEAVAGDVVVAAEGGRHGPTLEGESHNRGGGREPHLEQHGAVVRFNKFDPDLSMVSSLVDSTHCHSQGGHVLTPTIYSTVVGKAQGQMNNNADWLL